MHFFVDESGHTGNKLFDKDQPILYYGVLSSNHDIDVSARSAVLSMRRTLAVPRLHASDIGERGLVAIAARLLDMQVRYGLRFDVYRVKKPDHALICFFDQVFDVGMNPAVSWNAYWTPLRYVLLLKLAHLFDDDLLARAWAARINMKDREAEAELTSICRQLMGLLARLPDVRSRKVIGDALDWAACAFRGR